MTLERDLAGWAASAGDFSPQARKLAQDALVDVVACMIGGSAEPSTSAIADMARQFGTGRALTMISADRLPAPWAALVTGTAAHALDFDDNFGPAVTHATAVLAPALFALADEEGVPGAALVEAYLVGLELQARIGRLVQPKHYERGWHSTSTIGAIGTAGACARLLGLDADRILAAMSVAFSLAAGSKKQFGSMMKPIHAGLAAKNAVLAARMAQAGISGDPEPLNGRWSFADLYGGGLEASGFEPRSREALRREPCEILAIEASGLLAKRYPCCGAAHRTLDGLAELRDRYRFHIDDVEFVDAFIPEFARANLRFDEPENEMQARFSLTYCAARVLQSGRLALEDLTLERVRDAAIRPWLKRIRIHLKPGSVSDELGDNATPALTRVILKDGRVHEIAIKAPKGSGSAPLTFQEQREKFTDCCRWAGKGERAESLFELASGIHRAADFRAFSNTFAELLASGGPAS